MTVAGIYTHYFSGFHEISNFRAHDTKTNAVSLLKIVSYFTIIIPLFVAAAYCISSLRNRVSKKHSMTSQDKAVNRTMTQTIMKNNTPRSSHHIHMRLMTPRDKAVNSTMTQTIAKNNTPRSSHHIHMQLPEFQRILDGYIKKAKIDDIEFFKEYVTSIFNSSEFQEEPKQYTIDWREILEASENDQIPDNEAIQFFEKEILPKLSKNT